ncbi:MAG: hypothetical protein Q8O63_13845, partial [Hoeflea sp.]|nr:hypothetical protein [Hoeflea sp.]
KNDLRILILLEGRDASGKDGVIKRLIPILIELDSLDSQKRSNLNRWCKREVCDGFSGFFTDRL